MQVTVVKFMMGVESSRKPSKYCKHKFIMKIKKIVVKTFFCCVVITQNEIIFYIFINNSYSLIFKVNKYISLFLYYYYCYYPCEFFTPVHRSLSDSKFQVYRTPLSILADFNRAVVWMDSILDWEQPEYWEESCWLEDTCHLNPSERPSANVDLKKFQGVNNNTRI